MTPREIFDKCRKFHVGDSVNIIETVKGGNDNHVFKIKTPGKVVARYPYFLLIDRGLSMMECFTYIDIVIHKCIEKMKGRPKKSGDKQ